MESMRAAAVIAKGVMMALTVASEDTMVRANRAHATYQNVVEDYKDTLRKEQEALFKGMRNSSGRLESFSGSSSRTTSRTRIYHSQTPMTVCEAHQGSRRHDAAPRTVRH